MAEQLPIDVYEIDVDISVFSKGATYNESTLQYCYLQLRMERNYRSIEKAKNLIALQKGLIASFEALNKTYEAIMPPPF